MKRKIILQAICLLILLLAIPSPVSAQGPSGDQVVVGDSFALANGETLNGNLVVLGGVANLAEGSTVTGDIMITGGALNIQGTVIGSINTIGTAITLGDKAVVEGDINYVGGALVRSDGAKVKGIISTSSPEMFKLPFILGADNIKPRNLIDFEPVGNAIWAIFQILALSCLAVLVVLLLPKPTHRLVHVIKTKPLQSAGIGLLSMVIAPALVVLLLITILLIPLGLVGILMLLVAAVFGWIALGFEIGKRIASLFKANWAEPISAGLGTLVITTISVIPCLGWTAAILVAMLGLGSVILTRFGTMGEIENESSADTIIKSEPAHEGTPTDLLPPVA